MAETPGEKPKLHVDSDWKEEARREKERLAQETEGTGPLPEASFAEIINMILMQALVGLGGMQTSDGRALPPDLEVARHYIDLLALLGEKTKGNLTPDEDRLLGAALYEVRMRFVQATTASPGGAVGTAGRPPTA